MLDSSIEICLLNFIQDGRHLSCIYGRIQCRLLVKDRFLHVIFFILLEDFQVSSHFQKMKKDASLDFCASSGC
jgi:hypothetical protein